MVASNLKLGWPWPSVAFEMHMHLEHMNIIVVASMEQSFIVEKFLLTHTHTHLWPDVVETRNRNTKLLQATIVDWIFLNKVKTIKFESNWHFFIYARVCVCPFNGNSNQWTEWRMIRKIWAVSMLKLCDIHVNCVLFWGQLDISHWIVNLLSGNTTLHMWPNSNHVNWRSHGCVYETELFSNIFVSKVDCTFNNLFQKRYWIGRFNRKFLWMNFMTTLDGLIKFFN